MVTATACVDVFASLAQVGAQQKTHDPRHDLYTTPNMIIVFSLSLAMAVIRDTSTASQESLEIKYDQLNRPIIHLGLWLALFRENFRAYGRLGLVGA